MPQMMPINWIFSFFFFLFIFILFNIMNYYIFNLKLMAKTQHNNNTQKNFLWKW